MFWFFHLIQVLVVKNFCVIIIIKTNNNNKLFLKFVIKKWQLNF